MGAPSSPRLIAHTVHHFEPTLQPSTAHPVKEITIRQLNADQYLGSFQLSCNGSVLV